MRYIQDLNIEDYKIKPISEDGSTIFDRKNKCSALATSYSSLYQTQKYIGYARMVYEQLVISKNLPDYIKESAIDDISNYQKEIETDAFITASSFALYLAYFYDKRLLANALENDIDRITGRVEEFSDIHVAMVDDEPLIIRNTHNVHFRGLTADPNDVQKVATMFDNVDYNDYFYNILIDHLKNERCIGNIQNVFTNCGVIITDEEVLQLMYRFDDEAKESSDLDTAKKSIPQINKIFMLGVGRNQNGFNEEFNKLSHKNKVNFEKIIMRSFDDIKRNISFDDEQFNALYKYYEIECPKIIKIRNTIDKIIGINTLLDKLNRYANVLSGMSLLYWNDQTVEDFFKINPEHTLISRIYNAKNFAFTANIKCYYGPYRALYLLCNNYERIDADKLFDAKLSRYSQMMTIGIYSQTMLYIWDKDLDIFVSGKEKQEAEERERRIKAKMGQNR